MNLSAGTVLGHYEILRSIGAGGMGEVYLARDRKLRREVAIKVLPQHVAGSPDSLNRFEREALVLAQISHPNILAIHDFDRIEDVTLAVTEYLEGETLRDRLDRASLPARRALEIGAQVAEGLAAAHSKGIVHRDLKPENIFLTRDDQVKILDFGLARADILPASDPDKPDSSPTQTEPGIVKGTIGYMAPEQLRGLEVDGRSDIFSLGCVLYEMLTGKRAFARATVADTMTAILKDNPPDFLESGRHVPPEAERVTHHCLEKDPSRRFQSSLDLALHLRSLASSPDIDRGKLRGGLWKRFVGAAAVAAAIVILALAFWFGYNGLDRSKSTVTYQERPTVAVMFFENLTGDPSFEWMRSALTNMLVTDLSQSTQIEVLGTDRLYQILNELGSLEDPAVSSATVEEVARRTRVSTVVLGSFLRAGDTFRLTARLQEAQSGRIIATESVEGAGEAAIFKMVDEITARIKSRLEIPHSESALERGIESVTSSSVEAFRHYVEGNDLHILSKEREALAPLERAVELDPDFAMALAKLSVVHWNLGHVREAHDYARRALQHVDRLTARERYYIEGRYYSLTPATLNRGVEAYESLISLYPTHGPGRHNLATLYAEMERYDDAIAQFEELVRSGTSFSGTYSNLAACYRAIRTPEKGLDLLREYVRDHPNVGLGHSNLGLYLTQLGHYDEALAAFREARVWSPGDTGIRAREFTVHVLLEDWDEAGRLADRLVSTADPVWGAEGRVGLAMLHLYRGRLQPALDQLEQAASQLPPNDPIRSFTLLLAGRIHLLVGRPEEALRSARAAFETGRGYPIQGEAHALAAMAYARLKQEQEALGVFEDYRAEYRTFPEVLVNRRDNTLLGTMALLEGKLDEATVRLAEAATTIENHNPWRDDGIPFLYGWALWEAGQKSDAIAWLEQFVKGTTERVQSPIEYVRSLYLLGDAYAAGGNTEKAREYFSRFLAHWGEGEFDRPQVERARQYLRGS